MRISRATLRHWNKQRIAERAAKWEAERVAILAAAAPDLLELARQVVLAADQNEGDIPADIVRGARAAIDKATGV